MGLSNPEKMPVMSVDQVESVEVGRARIDKIDESLLALLNERAALAIAIGAIKRRDSKSRLDITREYEIIERMTALNQGPLTDQQVADLFFNLFGVTKEVQETSPEWPGSMRDIAS